MKLAEVAGLPVTAIELVAQCAEKIPVPISRGGGLGYFDGANFTPKAEATRRARGALEAFALLLTPV